MDKDNKRVPSARERNENVSGEVTRLETESCEKPDSFRHGPAV